MGAVAPFAAIGGSLLNTGTQLFGASEEASAAANAQRLEQQYYNQMAQNEQPYMTLGANSAGLLGNLLGEGPGGSAGIQSTLANLPGYQFTLNQGLKSTQNAMAARGLGNSGAALKAADSYATGLAQQNYGQYAQQLFNATGIGESAATALGSAGLGAGRYQGDQGDYGAQAIASGSIGAANSLAQGFPLYNYFNSPAYQNFLNGTSMYDFGQQGYSHW